MRLVSMVIVSVIPFLFMHQVSSAVSIDRVVAFVDDVAITERELDRAYEDARKLKADVDRADVLQTVINRQLLLKEARSLRLKADDDDALLNLYIDLKIRVFIRVSEEDVRDFYEKNSDNFEGTGYSAVRGKIEKYLIERAVNSQLKEHLNKLREKAYVKVLL